MPITPSYPGVYIEEIPNSAHSITPAPTSVAVFIGYSHPFRTRTGNFGKAVSILSFADYEREFGGFFASDTLSADLPYAVNEFFTNGGSIAWVVGLKASNNTNTVSAPIKPATAVITTTGAGSLTLTALEPLDPVDMVVSIIPGAANTRSGDLTLVYGHRIETFRGVSLDPASPAFIVNVLANGSSLASADATTVSGTDFMVANDFPFTNDALPAGFTGTFSGADFTSVFATDGSLDKVDIFNLLVLPGISSNSVLSAALAFAERKRAFLIMDPKAKLAADLSDPNLQTDIQTDFSGPTVPKSPNGAIYFPYLLSQNAITGAPIELPPSGFVAGIFARTDTNRGVWKAPAGLETTVLDTTGVVARGRMTDLRQGFLNNIGVNCIRSFPVVSTVVYGARTLVAGNTAYAQWKYVPVRRLALLIEQTLARELKWAVFEPNDEPLWIALRTAVGSFMLSLFTQGAFQGEKPSQAYVVRCDSSTTTQDDIDRGIVNIIVGFRPLKPAEFVFVKIAQLAGQVQA